MLTLTLIDLIFTINMRHIYLFYREDSVCNEKIVTQAETFEKWTQKYFIEVQELEDTVTKRQHVTIFQTVTHAIEVCAREILSKNYRHESIKNFNEGQAMLKAPKAHKCNATLIWSCKNTLNTLRAANNLFLI